MPDSNLYPITDRLVTRKEKENLLGSKGAVFWLTGLSGSGKSTLAIELEKSLLNKELHSTILDGDNLRSGINTDLGFSDQDRRENIRRTSEIAKILKDSGLVVIVSCITPLNEFRYIAKSIISAEDYHEIFVKASFETCKTRDVKGLYAKAMNSEIESFTGQKSEFEIPNSPQLLLDTELETQEESSSKLLSYVMSIISKT